MIISNNEYDRDHISSFFVFYFFPKCLFPHIYIRCFIPLLATRFMSDSISVFCEDQVLWGNIFENWYSERVQFMWLQVYLYEKKIVLAKLNLWLLQKFLLNAGDFRAHDMTLRMEIMHLTSGIWINRNLYQGKMEGENSFHLLETST